MLLARSQFQCWLSAAIATLLLGSAMPAQAQETTAEDKPAQAAPAAAAKPAKQPQPYGGGSPLDVLMHSKLWETPPPAQPWVKATRTAPDTLHYQSTAVVADPKRPKLLNTNELQSLQDELEKADAHNHRAAGRRDPNVGPDLARADKRHHLRKRARTVAKAALHHSGAALDN
jgi:hypothetical protein